MNRFDRVTAILIHLQSRKVVKARDIAERFNVSLRTIYRDIRTLERAGIPILSEAGVGYSIVEGYRLPPVLFTKEEAASLLTAEKLIGTLADPNTSEQYKSAMYKIKSVLRSRDKELLEKIEGHLEVLSAKHQLLKTERLQSLQEILLGISERKVMFMRYFTQYNQQKTERSVEPVGVFFSGNNWHLIAYCRLRKDYRDFRIDRISHLNITDETFDRQHPTLKQYLERMNRDYDLENVTIGVDKKIARFIEEEKYYRGFVEETEKDGYMEMIFLTAWMEGFARWYLTLADHAYIVGPGKLKKLVKSLVTAISKRL
jgi:predicted DNA-binding transcriptional regulator YafY